MSRVFTYRATFRAIAAGVGPAVCASSLVMNHRILRCDTPSLARSHPQCRSTAFDLSPEIVAQVSNGSVAGFGIGLIVTLFSRTVALLTGLVAVTLHIASRYGLDVPHILGVRKYLDGNALWEGTKGKPLYTASFLATFLLATVVHI